MGYRSYSLLAIWSPLANGRLPLHIFTGISNCRETPCVARALRSAVNWRMGLRSIVGAASQNHRESNRGETGNGDPLWDRKPAWPVWPNHGGFGGHFTGVRPRITALPIHGTFPSSGPPNRVRYWTGMHTHVTLRFREPKRLKSFGKTIPKDGVGYRRCKLLAI